MLYVQQQENTNQIDNTRENLSVSVDPRGTVASERIDSAHDTGGEKQNPDNTRYLLQQATYIYTHSENLTAGTRTVYGLTQLSRNELPTPLWIGLTADELGISKNETKPKQIHALYIRTLFFFFKTVDNF